jgi:hypothetical protein
MLVNEELPQAACHQAAVAPRHWWGVSAQLVCWWQKAQAVIDRVGTEGCGRLLWVTPGGAPSRLPGRLLRPEPAALRVGAAPVQRVLE